MDIETVADELYGLPLDDFVPIRTAREKEAKKAGSKELAAEIRRMPKPNIVAWLVNQLVRQRRSDIEAMLELGPAMREATATLSRDRLRDLSRQQHQVIRGLVEAAEHLAVGAGRQVGADAARGLEETFYATLADQTAGDAVAAGHLTTGLRSTGFAGLASSDTQPPSAPKHPSGPSEPPPRGGRRGVDHRERADARVAKAEVALDSATAARDEARAMLQQAEQSVADADRRVERLHRELEKAVEAQADAETDRRRAQAGFGRAERGAQVAQQRLTDAARLRDRSAP